MFNLSKVLIATLAILISIGEKAMAGPFEDALAASKQGDYANAFRLWLPLAQQGNPSAQHNIGIMLDRGKGVARDSAAAVQWWRRAAIQGFTAAQSSLGFAYVTGRGVTPDLSEAIKWYRRAADSGDAYAQSNLGAAYGEGKGVPQDWVASTKWYRLAAEQGHPIAQSNLGVAYANGQGIARDYVQAYKWYCLAISSFPASDTEGRTIAVDNQARLAPLMTSVQIAEAENLAREWKATTQFNR